MKVSLNWIKQFSDVDISVDELVRKIGAQLGAVEEVVDVGAKYKGALIVRVASCQKHPNADKLSLCMVDDGGVHPDVVRNEHGHIQVVCGAPNVHEGMLAVWLPPGATVPSSYDTEPFVLDTRELRGEVSNGMLASAQELAIGNEHGGIVEVDIKAQPGAEFAKTYELDDFVLDIENKMFTHRPDCFGILGVAREIAGILGKSFTSPDWYRLPLQAQDEASESIPLRVNNSIPDMVPRFMAVTMRDVTIKQSPLIMRSYLARVGIRPINNIVDATNYVMALTAQPLHAYDADKLRKLQAGGDDISLETRLSKKGDKLKTLDGKAIVFADEKTILITSNDVPVGVGGVMGGADTEVDDDTKNIVLECANFDMYAIRRASMRHGLFTDAVTRFNKGQSPQQNDRVIREAMATIQYVSGATAASKVVDEKADLAEPTVVTMTSSFIEKRLGMEVSAGEVIRLLSNVEFAVHSDADAIYITPPFWRTDISIAEDIVEEIGRLIGFDSLRQELPKRTIQPVTRNEHIDFQYRIRDMLTAAGANEVLTYSFVHGKLIEQTGQDTNQAYRVVNAISPQLQYYRVSLTPSLLSKVRANIKAGHEEFVLYELGKVHVLNQMDQQEPEVPAEYERLALVYAADSKAWQKYGDVAPYYQALQYLEVMLSRLGVEYSLGTCRKNDDIGVVEAQRLAPYDKNRSACIGVDGNCIGVIGEPKQSVLQALKLPAAVAMLEIDIPQLLVQSRPKSYTPLSRYPSVEQDISFRLPAATAFGDVIAYIRSTLITDEHVRYEVTPLDIYQPEDDASSKHYAFRISMVSTQKTMTNKEVTATLDELAAQVNKTFDATRL